MAISARLQRPVDAASLAAFRIGFGALLLVTALRYFAHGWIAEYFLRPAHFFKYWGFGWVQPWPGVGMYVHFAMMTLCALGVLLGYRYRLSVALYGLLFAYAHLIDKTHYLNHYYLVMCLCALMACLPLAAKWSLDARRVPASAREQLPTWMLWALRAQLGLVYVFGGLAKLNADWLLRAQPLTFWLERHSDLPLLGTLSGQPWVAFAMSWAGALFDLSVVPLLLVRRTRPFAYVAVIVFHLLTARLFSIGMFPFFMICGSLLFLEPSWPRRLGARWSASATLPPSAIEGGLRRWQLGLLGVYFAVQLLLPLRHLLYSGDPRWSEQGFRFSWNVMLMEKNAVADFRVVAPESGRVYQVSPNEYFTPYQTAMMAGQPDMVLEAAHVVAGDFRRRQLGPVAVYADVFASLNGRPMQRLVDPHVDLSREVDGLSNQPWILPMQPEHSEKIASLGRSSR